MKSTNQGTKEDQTELDLVLKIIPGLSWEPSQLRDISFQANDSGYDFLFTRLMKTSNIYYGLTVWDHEGKIAEYIYNAGSTEGKKLGQLFSKIEKELNDIMAENDEKRMKKWKDFIGYEK